MRSFLQLPWTLWVLFLVFLVQMSSHPASPQASSLPQRPERQIRQARQSANIPLYRSPRRQRVLAPRLNGDLESQRMAHRDADREQQLALQETPSRRRRMPEHRAGDENRAPSPTPAAPRPFFCRRRDGTPPDSQRPVVALPLDKRTLDSRHDASANARSGIIGLQQRKPPRILPLDGKLRRVDAGSGKGNNENNDNAKKERSTSASANE
ncbi:hypothetical protein B0H13DRAFT_2300979 [Mycena leptocephala]|nr:hypothetical protein B0H13DRAFT_2300979 [Mycena leptocephala]